MEEGRQGLQENVVEFAKKRIGYMCKIDFDHELSHASGGNRVYPSVDDLKIHHEPAMECGIVEVEVRLTRVITPGEYS